MADKDYLYAVAVIRANEASLLTQQDMEQLIAAPDYRKAIEMLSAKGYEQPQGNDYSAMLDAELQAVWKMLTDNAPDAEELNLFIVRNDFQNLKACLKAEVADLDAREFFVKPSVIDPEELLGCVSERAFDKLPEFISDAAEKAFDTVTKTGNGQLCDIIADTAAMKAMQYFSGKSSEPMLKEYARLFCLAGDIKAAYRCALTGKGKAFLEAVVAPCEGLDTQALIGAALEGDRAVLEFLSENGLDGYRQALENGASAFEKYCDDRLLDTVRSARYISIGIAPLAAYYVAKETEIKALRIILSAKISGASQETVRERMRELYV